MAPAGFDHGAIIGRLQYLLARHVFEHELGIVAGAETGFRLSRRPDTVRGADVAFVRTERIPASGRPTGYFEGAPDLAVEVLSPTDTVEEIEEKVDDYLNGGCPLVWVVNPRRKTVTAYRADGDPKVYRENDTLDGGAVLPGFACRVGEVFA